MGVTMGTFRGVETALRRQLSRGRWWPEERMVGGHRGSFQLVETVQKERPWRGPQHR